MTSGIIQILINNSTVQNAVGREAGKYKVYPVVASHKAETPYVCVQKVSNEMMLGKDCFSHIDTSTYEVRVWSKSGFRETEEISEICRRALETSVPVNTSACLFNKIWTTNDYDTYDNNVDMFCHVSIFQGNVVRS